LQRLFVDFPSIVASVFFTMNLLNDMKRHSSGSFKVFRSLQGFFFSARCNTH
jgi:hypothetical protein